MKKFIILFILTIVLSMSEIAIASENVSHPIQFYDLKTGQEFEPPLVTIVPGDFDMASLINVRLPFIGTPCSCESLTCGCCAGMKIDYFNFNQNLCMNFTYDPNEFAILWDMNLNENSIYGDSMSGRDPPPLCIPVPLGPLPLPGVDMCMKVFNIFTPGYNLHMCMDIMARVSMSPIMILHFDCMRFGRDEWVLLKPEDNGGFEMMGENMENEGGSPDVDVGEDPVDQNKKPSSQ